MKETIERFFKFMDEKLGPDRDKHPPACLEDREMFMECVLESDCFKIHNDFKRCSRGDIDKACKALRYNYFRCRRSSVFWEKSLRDDPR